MSGRTALPRLGSVARGPDGLLPWLVLDGAGREVEPVSSYLRDRLLGDVSPLTCRSYAYDLLRWFRVLWPQTRVSAGTRLQRPMTPARRTPGDGSPSPSA